MAKKVENLTRQCVPILHKASDGSLELYLLKDREAIIVADSRISQDLTDKETAGHLRIVTSGLTPVAPFD